MWCPLFRKLSFHISSLFFFLGRCIIPVPITPSCSETEIYPWGFTLQIETVFPREKQVIWGGAFLPLVTTLRKYVTKCITGSHYGGTLALLSTPGNYLWQGRKGVHAVGSTILPGVSRGKLTMFRNGTQTSHTWPLSVLRGGSCSPWVRRSRPVTRKRGQSIHSAKHPQPWC